MERDEINQQNNSITNKDQQSKLPYQTRPLAFKNGVLYIELILSRQEKHNNSYRQMAVQAAIHYRGANYGYEAALAAKISVYISEDDISSLEKESRDHTLDSIIGIMYQDGILN